MTDTPLYPEDYDRDFWIEFLLRLVEANATDTELAAQVELAREAVWPYARTDIILELLAEHRTEWQDYFHAKRTLRLVLTKLLGGVPPN